MSCSSVGSNLIEISLNMAVTSFEAIVPILQASGIISMAAGQALNTYVTTAVSDLDGALADIKASKSTLSTVLVLVQNVQAAYNNLAAAELPAALTLYVNVSATAVEIVIKAIQAEIGPSTPVSAEQPAIINAHGSDVIHAGLVDRMKLGSYQDRLRTVAKSVAAAIAVQGK